MPDTHIPEFMNAAANLLQTAIEQARAEDQAAVDGLASMLRAGGLVAIRASFAPMTGMAQLAVEIVETSGNTHTLMTTELHRTVLQ